MSNVLKKLFSAPDVVTNGMKAIDAVVLTKEEMGDFTLRFLEAMLPANLARRYIAVILTALFTFLVLMAAFLWGINKEWAEFIFHILEKVVTVPMGMVLTFYFTVWPFVKGKTQNIVRKTDDE